MTNNMERVEVAPLKMDDAERQREAEILKNCTQQELSEMFQQLKDSGKTDKIKMTEEEAKRIQDCMDKPEFMGLFKDYVNDISDPKNMEEYDQYIRQLEEEGGIPSDEEVVRPQKGFCIKTKSVDTKAKIFVNCCGTDKVPAPSQRSGSDPTAKDATGNPGSGTHFSIPYIFTSCRMDRDNHDTPCHVYDILFNQEALKMAEKAPQFKALVVQTSLEAMEDLGKLKLKNQSTGKYEHVVLQNMKYKGKVVRPHKIKKDSLEQPRAPPKEDQKPNKPQPKPKASTPPEDPTKPKVTIIHRGQFELEQTLQTFGKLAAPLTSRPKQLVVKIELPLLKSLGDMDLETKGGFLELKVPGVYNLKYKLPFPVDDASGDAKYNKTQRLLTVTLDVHPWKPEEIEATIEQARKAEEKKRLAEEAEAERVRKQQELDAKRVVKKGFLAGSGAGGNDSRDGKLERDASLLAAEQASGLEEESKEHDLGVKDRVSKPLIDEIVPEQTARVDAGAGDNEKKSQVGQERASNNAGEEDGGIPAVNFRQNDQNLTMVVRVPRVDEASVKFEYRRSCVVLDFCAVSGGKRLRYQHTVHLWGDLDPVRCRHDVSLSNIVVILHKQSPGRWDTFLGEARPESEPIPAAVPLQEDDGKGASKGDADAGKDDSEDGGDKPPSRTGSCLRADSSSSESRHVRWAEDLEAPPSASVSTPRASETAKEGDGHAQKAAEAGESGVEQAAAAAATEEVDDADFQKADKFSGSREGFAFKMGTRGLGYYRDTHPSASDAAHLSVSQSTSLPENEAEFVEEEKGQEGVAATQAQSCSAEASEKKLPKLGFANNLIFELD